VLSSLCETGIYLDGGKLIETEKWITWSKDICQKRANWNI
jgi:hypothetical protein